MLKLKLSLLLERFKKTYYNLSRHAHWSALTSIGNSRLAKLTILMPIVGYLVIFNSTLTTLIETTIPQIPITEEPDSWDLLFDRNLVFLYFGLLIFGTGVAVYNTLVPYQIRSFPSVRDYISSMENIGTRNLVIGSLNRIVAMYYQHVEQDIQELNPAFPDDVRDAFDRLFEEIFRAIETDEFDETKLKEIGTRFLSANDNVMIGEVVKVACFRIRAERAIWHSIDHEAAERSKDIFYIEHRALEYSKPKARLLVLFLYAAGLFLTVFPSILTSVIIIKNW